MKKLLWTFMFCVLLTDTYAQEKPIYEVPCKVVKPSPFFGRSTGDFPYKGELQPGEIINVTNIATWRYLPPVNDEKGIIFFNKDKSRFCTFPENLVPVTTSMLFEQDILTDTTTFLYEDKRMYRSFHICKEMWVPVHYADVLRSRDRETLTKYEPQLVLSESQKAGYEAMRGSPEWYDVKYQSIADGLAIFFNPIIYFKGNGEFLIKTIEKHEYGYKVECFTPRDLYAEYSSPSILIPYFNWSFCTGETVTLFLDIDGEYMDIYMNEMDALHKFGTIIRVKEEFIRQYQDLIKKGVCDLTNVRWSRRADGSMDYPPPALSADPIATAEDKIPQSDIDTEKTNTEKSAMPLWALIAIIGGVATVGSVVVFEIKRKRRT
jgi:hypothetical protein